MKNVEEIAVGKIISVGYKFIMLDSNGFIYTIYKNEITDYKKVSVFDMFKIGEVINFVILKKNVEKNSGIGSFKQNHLNHSSEIIKAKLKETTNGFKNLYNYSQNIFEKEEINYHKCQK
ncbi:hypothetical protein [Mycoplasma leonicaptivi]|uniref:hypothetical protein n=1 Tax=Mycoplasma leonicaptivi TaxID=36742 RepID=UPI0005698AED|nr:hypothetical protein [Mycoplasma leonicaptivi]